VRNADGRQEVDPWVAAGNGVSGCMGADCRKLDFQQGGSRETMWPEAPSRPPVWKAFGSAVAVVRRARGVAGIAPLGVAPRHHGAGAASAGIIWGRPAEWTIGDEAVAISGAG